MKRFVFVLALVLASSFSGVKAQDEIDLEEGIYDPTQNYEPIQKGPMVVPSVSIEDYTLYFITPCDGCLLQLLNEDGEVEYAILIPDYSETLTLPFYLEGEFELQIVRGQYCFYGYIEL